MTNSRIYLSGFLVAALFALTACGGGHSGEQYVFISTNIKVPYWQTAVAGFSQSAEELKVGYQFTGSDTYDPAAERVALQRSIESNPTGSLTAVGDADEIGDSMDRGSANGK